MVKKRGGGFGIVSRALITWAALLFLVSCAVPRQFTKEELEIRGSPASDRELARLVDITMKHGYDLRDYLAPRTRYLMLERSQGEEIDRRYFEVELEEGGPISVFFLINVGSRAATRLRDYPRKPREEVERFMTEEEARGGEAAPVMIEKTFMVKDAFAQKNGRLMFSRGVVRVELTEIFGASHEKGKLYRYFGQRSLTVGAREMEAADEEFQREVQRFLEAYDQGGP